MSATIDIVVNGESREVAAGTNIEALLSLLELPRERIAVELNRRIVRKTSWPEVELSDGDRLEIVHFVGGG